MKVALAIPPIDEKLSFYGKEFDWGWWPPLGLLSIASYLKKNIPDVEILLCDEQAMTFEEMKSRIIEFDPDWLGVSPSPFTYDHSLILAGLGYRTVFGGHYASSRGKLMLQKQNNIHAIVAQDGEDAMLGIVQARNYRDIPNLIWRDGQQIIANEIKYPDLNNLPPVDYSFVDLEAYFANYRKAQRQINSGDSPQRPLTMSAQRGCRWRENSGGGCLFCSCIYPAWRGKDPCSVWRDIMDNSEKYRIDGLLFGEDDFLANFDWFEEFYRHRPRTGHPRLGFIFTRPDSINKRTAFLLAELNCYHVYLGVEAGNNRCLKNLHKGTSVSRIIKAAGHLHDHHISSIASFVLGAPGETAKTLEQTRQLAEKLCGLGSNLFTAYPLVPVPGSKSWQMAMAHSALFREHFFDDDKLDIPALMQSWINAFCKVDLERILETCDAINNLSFTQRKSSENWVK